MGEEFRLVEHAILILIEHHKQVFKKSKLLLRRPLGSESSLDVGGHASHSRNKRRVAHLPNWRLCQRAFGERLERQLAVLGPKVAVKEVEKGPQLIRLLTCPRLGEEVVDVDDAISVVVHRIE